MDFKGLLAIYTNVAGLTEKMLAAARSGDWEQVAVLETSYVSQVTTLKREEASASVEWSSEANQAKAILIKKILSDHSEIGQLTEPRLAQLHELIDSTHTERKLVQTYGSVSDI